MPEMSSSEQSLFTAALGLQAPWKVVSTDFDPAAKRIDLEVDFECGARFACTGCGAPDQPVHDSRRRTW